jgi:hypothetical protein
MRAKVSLERTSAAYICRSQVCCLFMWLQHLPACVLFVAVEEEAYEALEAQAQKDEAEVQVGVCPAARPRRACLIQISSGFATLLCGRMVWAWARCNLVLLRSVSESIMNNHKQQLERLPKRFRQHMHCV